MQERGSVIGLGKLGASMAAAFASRGFEVVGVDVSQIAVDLVNAGKAPVQETGLGEMIAETRDRLRAHPVLCHMSLLRRGQRLSILPVSDAEWAALSPLLAKA